MIRRIGACYYSTLPKRSSILPSSTPQPAHVSWRAFPSSPRVYSSSMPKKHSKHISVRPVSTPHPSLATSSSTHHGKNTPSASDSSVNDLIHRLRTTRVSSDQPSASDNTSITRSVHPSLRNLLALPDALPPRPRPGTTMRHAGPGRLRRTPGPPPPASWLNGSMHAPKTISKEVYTAQRETIHVPLPGCTLPRVGSLQDYVLKAIAREWQWHLEYDNTFLAELPVRVKEILLTYVAIHHDSSLLTPVGRSALGSLFPEDLTLSNDDVQHLDLGLALGSWLDMKQLHRDLIPKHEAPRQLEERTTEALEEDLSWDEQPDTTTTPHILSPHLRFPNLTHLSLAISGQHTRNFPTWAALLKMAPHLSTLTHLSLAHWPIPTLTPNALASNAFIRSPVSGSRISYGGTDFYAEFDGDWTEAAGLLKRLSQHLYCLKWLDLTGCGAWFSALRGGEATRQDWDAVLSVSSGPEWNGGWRRVEWLGLGVGWTPRKWVQEEPLPSPLPTADGETWDIEVERERHYLDKEEKEFKEIRAKAIEVAKAIQTCRKSKKGGWIACDFGRAS